MTESDKKDSVLSPNADSICVLHYSKKSIIPLGSFAWRIILSLARQSAGIRYCGTSAYFIVSDPVNENESWSQGTEFISVISHPIKSIFGAEEIGADADAGAGGGASSSLERAVAPPR